MSAVRRRGKIRGAGRSTHAPGPPPTRRTVWTAAPAPTPSPRCWTAGRAVFDGRTGAALATVDYEPARGNVADWGDSGGNRSDRFLGASAHLDGVLPSIVMTRGYYAKTMLVAYDWRGGKLTRRWTFSGSDHPGYGGQGNHNPVTWPTAVPSPVR
ncbi:hypothetical protein AB0J35_57290 [Nonomuraea angiospora]|uniref:rhamnogalacturonan lyase family protein n=1 Tax=Nonomuraea angiospora TaxID=46172 RepID=UPI003445D5A2